MGSRRTIILIAAIVIGAIAAFALYTYVGGIEDEANDNAERVQVFKVVKDIPKGFFGDEAFAQGYIKSDEIPREFRPNTAITQESQIAELVATNTIPANQVVVQNQWASQAEVLASFSERLEADQMAVTISVDQVKGVAGLLVPGDVVNLVVCGRPVDAQNEEATVPVGGIGPDEAVYPGVARFLYQKVKILAIGQSVTLEPGETATTNADGTVAAPSSGLITFAVPAEAAQRIIISSAPTDELCSGLYLTLVPKDYEPVPVPPHDQAEVLPGEDPERLTPYGPDGPQEN